MTLYVGNDDAVTQKVKKAYIGVDGIGRNIKAMYVGDDDGIARKVFPDEHEREGLLFTSQTPFKVKLLNDTWYGDGTVEYSNTDNVWSPWDGTEVEAKVINGNEYKLYFRGTGNTASCDATNSSAFVIVNNTGETVDVKGKLGDLLNYKSNPTSADVDQLFIGCPIKKANELKLLDDLENYSYFNLFKNCTELISAPKLPQVTTVPKYSLQKMFNGCSKLTTVPNGLINVTVEKCGCDQMFYNCTSLVNIPEFNFALVKQQGISKMFYGCSKLKDASNMTIQELTSDDDTCWSTFEDCAELLHPPVINATKVGAYGFCTMFQYCYALLEAPNLNNLTSIEGKNAMDKMFRACTHMTTGPAILKPTTLSKQCYYYMFEYCFELAQAPEILATDASGEFCCAYMFHQCKKITSSPDLSNVSIIGPDGFHGMFWECEALKTPTKLNPTTIGQNGCQVMYDGAGITWATSGTRYSVPYTHNPSISVGSGGLTGMFVNNTGFAVPTGTPVVNTDYYYTSA